MRQVAGAILIAVLILTPAVPVCAGTFSDLVTNPGGLGANLAAYWRLGETSLSTAYDQTSHHYDGTYTGFAAGDLGKTGALPGDLDKAAYFDGSDNYVDFGDVIFDNATAFTIAMWVKLGDLNNDGALITKGTFGANQPLLIWRDDTANNSKRTDTYSFMVTGTSGGEKRLEAATNAASDTTTWHFLAFVFQANDSQGLRLYIDGVVDPNTASTTGLTAIADTATSVRLGAPSPTQASKQFMGYLDEVAIFNRVLTGSEIGDLFDAAPAPEPATLALLALGGAAMLARRRRR
jgi:hypothetical protein